MSAHEDVHDVWGQIIWRRSHVIAGVKMLYFEKQYFFLLFVVYVLHDDEKLIFNSRFGDVRADLCITAHVCGVLRLHGKRSWSRLP